MFILTAGTDSGADVGDITKSLRFRASASTYIVRTSWSGANRQTWAFSAWVKRGALGERELFGAYDGSSTWASRFYFTASDALAFDSGGSAQNQTITTAVFRDPSAWYHILLVLDTTQAQTLHSTSTSRVRIYVNNTQQTTSGTLPTQNLNTQFFIDTRYILIGNRSSSYFDGYMARVCGINGSTAGPSSFGYLNTEINEWVSKSQSAVKAVVDAGGTNSFMLDFDNGSSLTTLGYDKSSNGNNWTLTNHSLTAGTSYDWMDDRPGNSYATLNPITVSADREGTFADGNLGVTQNTSTVGAVSSFSSIALPSSGKFYVEATAVSGISSALSDIAQFGLSALGDATNSVRIATYVSDARKSLDGALTSYGTTYASGNVIGMTVDCSTKTVEFFKNNASQGSMVYTGSYSVIYVTPVASGATAGNRVWAVNFGQRPFTYTPPSGFKALCQQNLSDPAVLNPRKHFDVLTWAGNSSARTFSGAGHRPDLVWVKGRGSTTYNNVLMDSVRGTGTGKKLSSNLTVAESGTGIEDTFGYVSAFTSDGFSIATTSGYAQYNQSPDTYVAWLFKAGGTGVTNTNGSITSTVSANTEMGFSIVLATVTSAGGTIGHGLGKAPTMVIGKNRAAGSTNWGVWHSAFAANEYVLLNTTAAKTTSATIFNGVSSTTFTVGSGWTASSAAHVFYCFTDSSMIKTGSYTGNGSADGPFVFCGFKPRFVLIKRSTVSTADWIMLDSSRPGYNVIGGNLYPNSALAEDTQVKLDLTSSGFKIRNDGTHANINVGSSEYIYLAIAETAGKYSNSK